MGEDVACLNICKKGTCRAVMQCFAESATVNSEHRLQVYGNVVLCKHTLTYPCMQVIVCCKRKQKYSSHQRTCNLLCAVTECVVRVNKSIHLIKI